MLIESFLMGKNNNSGSNSNDNNSNNNAAGMNALYFSVKAPWGGKIIGETRTPRGDVRGSGAQKDNNITPGRSQFVWTPPAVFWGGRSHGGERSQRISSYPTEPSTFHIAAYG